MTRASTRRGLLTSALLLAVVLILLDLVRPDSLLRGAWTRVGPESRTPAERTLEEFRRTRGSTLRP